jgi:hypothetical protein
VKRWFQSFGCFQISTCTATPRLSVAADGAVQKLTWLADCLVPSPGDDLPSPTEIRDAIMLEIAGTMMDTSFPPADGPSEITLPFEFD